MQPSVWWVLLELGQIRRPGSGNVSLPRMRPTVTERGEGHCQADDSYRRVEFDARYVFELSSVTREPLLMVFSEHELALAQIGERLADGQDIALIEVTPQEILHRVFRGDRNGLCVVNPVAVSMMLAGEAERHELASVPTTIGELIGEEQG